MAIHLERNTLGGSYAIWSDLQDDEPCSGRCIGLGDTLEEAKLDAISELNADLAEVKALAETGDDEDEADV
jgi:hypothetical protein